MTRFAEMPQPSRDGWMLWAESHDWGAGPARWTNNQQTGELALHVESLCFDPEGGRSVETFLAHTPRELKDWAGY